MFEHPQYLTPRGLRRSGHKPAGGTRTPTPNGSATPADPPLTRMLKQRLVQKRRANQGISKDAARLIAQALKVMLRE